MCVEQAPHRPLRSPDSRTLRHRRIVADKRAALRHNSQTPAALCPMRALANRVRYLVERLRHAAVPALQVQFAACRVQLSQHIICWGSCVFEEHTCTSQEVQAGKADIGTAYQRVLEDVTSRKPALTHPMRVVGNAMSPSLNRGVAAGAIGETVLVRQIRGSDVHVGGAQWLPPRRGARGQQQAVPSTAATCRLKCSQPCFLPRAALPPQTSSSLSIRLRTSCCCGASLLCKAKRWSLRILTTRASGGCIRRMTPLPEPPRAVRLGDYSGPAAAPLCLTVGGRACFPRRLSGYLRGRAGSSQTTRRGCNSAKVARSNTERAYFGPHFDVFLITHQELSAADADDSRTWGPLQTENIAGRCASAWLRSASADCSPRPFSRRQPPGGTPDMVASTASIARRAVYSCRDAIDHGTVKNSVAAMHVRAETQTRTPNTSKPLAAASLRPQPLLP